ncbi:hypothetical protein Q3G72_002233 [Acer saccharum]|nr:hypothetical protein Q3G72_002233 [Acer saccharum]
MGLRSSGRKVSFEILSKTSSFEDADGSSLFYQSNSDPTRNQNDSQSDVSFENPKSRKRKKHRKKKHTTPLNDCAVIPEDPVNDHDDAVVSSEVVFENRSDLNCRSYVSGGSATSVCTVTSDNVYNKGELRQRNVNGIEEAESRAEESSTTTAEKQPQQQRMSEANGSVVTKLETAESLDWKRLMAEEDSNYSVERFHISAFLLFVLAQNILEAEGPWFQSFLYVGHTKGYIQVLVIAKEDMLGASALVKITSVGRWSVLRL